MTMEPRGIGPLALIPAGSTNGTLLPMPAGGTGIRLYLPPGSSVTFTVAHDQPLSAPVATITVPATDGEMWEEDLAQGQQFFVTAITGSPLYRVY